MEDPLQQPGGAGHQGGHLMSGETAASQSLCGVDRAILDIVVVLGKRPPNGLLQMGLGVDVLVVVMEIV